MKTAPAESFAKTPQRPELDGLVLAAAEKRVLIVENAQRADAGSVTCNEQTETEMSTCTATYMIPLQTQNMHQYQLK